ncbi:MAG TPA: hypothetical protein VM253_04410 [Candidatus Limnocylindrales bacterium]|nr:hypothetical protein [Candidatus Limnocylindrales bacterium]
MTELHAAAWPVVGVGLAILAAAAAVAAVSGRAPAALEWMRRAALALIVAQAAIGLALAARGAAPAELLHWVYGIAILVVLLAPGSLPHDTSAARRSWVLAAGSLVAVVLTWRLWASG